MNPGPLLRVSRPISACSRCRNAKIRCDGKLPACTACERAGKGAECSSSTDQFARGKERDYVSHLETRIERLERELRRRVDDTPTVLDNQGYRDKRGSFFDHMGVQKHEDPDVNELVSDFGYLAVNATSNAYHGFDGEMSLARLIIATARLDDYPSSVDLALPPKPVAMDLLQDCVNNVFILYPVMSFAAACGALERVYHQSQHLASPNDHWNVRLMIALGYCCRGKNRHDGCYGSATRLATAAIAMTGDFVMRPCSLSSLQSLVLLVVFSWLCPSLFEASYLLGIAARFMVEMGLHQVADLYDGMKAPQYKERRHLFHLVYVLDRTISMSRLDPCCFSDDSVDLLLPDSFTWDDASITHGLSPGPSNDLGKTLIELLQYQSSFYYDLLHTRWSQTLWPLAERIKLYNKNRAWLERIPPSTGELIRMQLETYINYAGTLVLMPSEQHVSTTCHYGKALAIENMCALIDNIVTITNGEFSVGCMSHGDLDRGLAAGQSLAWICRGSDGLLRGTSFEGYPENGGDKSLPLLSWDWKTSNLARVAHYVHQLDAALRRLGDLFGSARGYLEWRGFVDEAYIYKYTEVQ